MGHQRARQARCGCIAQICYKPRARSATDITRYFKTNSRLALSITRLLLCCVELIYLQIICLTIVSLHGTVCLVPSLNQSLLPRLNTLLELLIYPNL